MLCPNCGTMFAEGRVCPKCKMDAVIFKKSKNASIRLYNSGLLKAKEGNISGAVKDLERSLSFDKTNTKARDLLGLCHFRVGAVADALKHWIISSSYSPKESFAKDYIDALNRNTRMLDKYNDAIRQYNRAMEYMSQGSVDLAVIQLKKALDYNPEFVKALCLYALCCIEEKNYALALECVDRAIEIDNGCELALRYKNEIMSTPGIKKTKPKTEEDKKTDYSARTKSKKGYAPGGFDFLLVLGGAVVMAVILITLVFPGWVDGKNEKIKALEQKVEALTDENENGTSVFAVKYAELEKENEALKEENEKYKYEELHSEAILAMKEANLLAEQGKYLEAGKLLASLDYESFDDNLKSQFDSVSEVIYPTAAVSACEEGVGLFAVENYAEAKASFEFSYKAAPKGEKADDCLYYLGKIATHNGDKAAAKEYYENLINNFPESNFVTEAKNLIQGL